ncbi:MAG: Mrp/NBP35 family ATP-binding protein [bacterium]|nr:Mrp/NBP35 family ATP-binding protein [bacterium]
MPSREEVIEQLRTVQDPELHQDLVTLKMIKDVSVADSTVHVHVELTTPACPLKDQIGKDVRQAVGRLDGVKEVTVEFSAQVRGAARTEGNLPGVKNVIAVGAGKGGVGKSTASVMLAVGLARSGATVGLLDADIYGPSIPTLMGAQGARPQVSGERILPIEAAGVRVISIGFMIDPEQAVVWRGPMVHGVVTQFLNQVEWGELDYLIVDLPPGTGDVPLTLAQTIPFITGSVIICTPQDVALADARRAVRMYEQLKVGCLGVIENMSYYLCPSCGHRDEIFDHGGAEVAARDLDVPFLGAIPLNGKLRAFGDAGTPEKCFTAAGDVVREAIEGVVSAVAGQVSIKSQLKVAQPTLTIE